MTSVKRWRREGQDRLDQFSENVQNECPSVRVSVVRGVRSFFST
jgi:hypothetical protein